MDMQSSKKNKKYAIILIVGGLFVLGLGITAYKQYAEIAELQQRISEKDIESKKISEELITEQLKSKACEGLLAQLSDQRDEISKLKETISAFSIQAESCITLKNKMHKGEKQ